MQDLSSAPWLRRVIIIVLLAGLFILGFMVMQPFIVPVIWAAVLSYSTWGWSGQMNRWCGNNRTLGSLAMTLLLTAAVIVPTASIVWLLSDEVGNAYRETVSALSQQRRAAGRAAAPAADRQLAAGPECAHAARTRWRCAMRCRRC